MGALEGEAPQRRDALIQRVIAREIGDPPVNAIRGVSESSTLGRLVNFPLSALSAHGEAAVATLERAVRLMRTRTEKRR